MTILSRPDCSLCEEALALARRLQPAHGFTLEARDISNDPGLRARYGFQIPVVLLDGVEIGWGRVTEELLREALQRKRSKGARWRGSISRILSRLLGRR